MQSSAEGQKVGLLADAAAVAAPVQMLNMTLGGMMTAHTIFAVARLDIADHLKKGPRSAEELAVSVNAHAPSLYRLLRAAASAGVVTENPFGTFALTPLGETLRSDLPDSMRAMAIVSCARWRLEPWMEIARSIQSGQHGFLKVHEQPQYEYLSQHPEDERDFAAAMTALSKQDVQAVLAVYDFSSCKSVVDIGGGEGIFLAGLLRAYPSMRGIVFDRPEVAERATRFLRTQGLADRGKAVGGDFLDRVPYGGDLYAIKNVLLDWDNDQAIKILNNCKRVMNASSRVIIVEPLIPGPEEPHFSKLLDLEMLIVPGGRARTLLEHKELLAAAGFTLARVVAKPALMTILEAVLR